MTNKNVALSIHEIKQGLRNKRLYVVARDIGISYPTLKKMAEGQDLNYNINSLRAISKYLRDAENKEK